MGVRGWGKVKENPVLFLFLSPIPYPLTPVSPSPTSHSPTFLEHVRAGGRRVFVEL